LDGVSLEVLVADAMSDDGTRETLDRYRQTDPRLRTIDNPDKLVSAGLNRAIREANGEIIVRMDVHTEYAPDYIRSCLEELNRTGAENVGGPALTRADELLARAIAAAYHSGFACGGAKFHDPDYEGYVDTVTYGCWRKALFEKIGGFDENLPRNQDDEHNLRLRLAGGRVFQSRKVVSWYRPRNTLSALFLQYFQYGFWKVAVIRKHHRPASLRHLVPAMCLLCGAILLLGFILAIIGGSPLLRDIFVVLLIVSLSLYAAMSLFAAIRVASRNAWSLFPLLPVVFVTYHFSYGLGFLLGMASCRAPLAKSHLLRKLLTAITR